MTTITIKNNINLPKTEFNTVEELRHILNFMSIDFEEVPTGKISETAKKNYKKEKETPLKNFNYLTDESL